MNTQEKLLEVLASLKQANVRLTIIERKAPSSLNENLALAMKQDGKPGRFWMRKICFVIGHNFDSSLLCGPPHRAHCVRCGLDRYSAFPSPWTVAGWLEKRKQ